MYTYPPFMCGICGQLALTTHRDTPRAAIEAMCASLAHRGPDDHGVYAAGPVGLGATRLAIIDLAGGHQPLSNEDGTVWAVQNGEIYNYRELRAALEERGHRFATHSDTEVLVHLYEEHGDNFLLHLRGMFAVALWDARPGAGSGRGRLVLARDRLGIKPLVYALHEGVLYFASEIKALLVTGLPRRLDRVALDDYLTFNYVPAPRTMFDGIRKLPAAHALVWDGSGDGQSVQVRPYWDLLGRGSGSGTGTASIGNGAIVSGIGAVASSSGVITSSSDAVISGYGSPVSVSRAGVLRYDRAKWAELTDALEERLVDAVRYSMVSDVPVGAFLSGGLDSSLVVALMSRCTGQPIQTFSIGFREKSYDELPYARQVAERYGTQHHELIVEPQIETTIHALVAAFDEPFADSSAVASYYVAQMAAGHTKVVLSGDGGDEVFGGYVIYQADRLAGLYRRLPAVLADRLLPALAKRLPASDAKMSFDLKLVRFVENARRDPASAHGAWRMIFSEAQKAALYARHAQSGRSDQSDPSDQTIDSIDHDALALLRQYFDAYPDPDLLNRCMYVDSKVSLVDDMLTKVDRTSMAHSLEVRVPLLDHPLVEWMSTLPSEYKVHGLELKSLLKRVARRLLPAEVVDRPKAGFHVPVPAWLKHELRPLVAEQLGRAAVERQGVFDPEAVARLVDDHMAGRANYSRNLWGLLMFSLWYDRYLD